MNDLTPEQLATLKARFAEIDCEVTDVGEASFEIISSEFRARTLVWATPFFLEFTTFLFARPKKLFGGSLSKLHAFLKSGQPERQTD
jgi:hypothetical protein